MAPTSRAQICQRHSNLLIRGSRQLAYGSNLLNKWNKGMLFWDLKISRCTIEAQSCQVEAQIWWNEAQMCWVETQICNSVAHQAASKAPPQLQLRPSKLTLVFPGALSGSICSYWGPLYSFCVPSSCFWGPPSFLLALQAAPKAYPTPSEVQIWPLCLMQGPLIS